MSNGDRRKKGQIFDTLYGFIRLTPTEEAIINTPYYQRLRWIRQLGFANYIFTGAEHTRFAHAIGVLHCADQMVRAIGHQVDDRKLFAPKARDAATRFHQSVRVAALLHDVGTFPFSHSIEGAYIRFGEKLRVKGKLPGKQLANNHEHLGSFIIKNTDFEGGITRALKAGGLDPSEISRLIKGESSDFVGNQLLHSDIDADRMDYLMRDAHYTGIRYGQIDREYILFHLTTYKAKDPRTKKSREVLAVKENALHAVEDFLIARFAWYSQVVRNPSCAKYDVLAAHVALHLLEEGLLYKYDALFDMASTAPEKFFTFNDVYFMDTIQKLYSSGRVKDPILREKLKMLIFRIPPRTLRFPEAEHRILEVGKDGKIREKARVVKALQKRVAEAERIFKKYGTGREWILADVPDKDVIFTKRAQAISQRDPIKVLDKYGRPSLLVERDNALIGRLSGVANFIPNVYANSAAVELLKKKRFFA